MDVQINYLAVLLAAVSSMVVGSLWYLPQVFGKPWMKMTGVKMDRSAPTGAKAAWMYGSVFVASLLTAYVLAHVTFLANQYFRNSYLQDAVATAFWLWIGFTGARLYVHDTFEGRRKKLTLLNSMHELVTVLVMAVIIGLLQP
jgi:hypothetical protein